MLKSFGEISLSTSSSRSSVILSSLSSTLPSSSSSRLIQSDLFDRLLHLCSGEMRHYASKLFQLFVPLTSVVMKNEDDTGSLVHRCCLAESFVLFEKWLWSSSSSTDRCKDQSGHSVCGVQSDHGISRFLRDVITTHPIRIDGMPTSTSTHSDSRGNLRRHHPDQDKALVVCWRISTMLLFVETLRRPHRDEHFVDRLNSILFSHSWSPIFLSSPS